MSHTKENIAIQTVIPENWKTDKVTFSSDEVINAYQKGVTDGKTIHEKIVMDAFTNNLQSAFKLSEKLFKFIMQEKFTAHSLYLKPENVSKFEALCVVDIDDYIKDDFLKVYDFSNQVESENKKETFDICFSFMPLTDKLNIDRIHMEGYYFTYEPKKIRPRSS